MRIRTIKPEFWSHNVMAKLPDDFQLLALALLSMADDHGYFQADPAIVRGSVMPFREDLARIREGLARLSEAGWIVVKEHPEQGKIGRITAWDKHQRVDHARDSSLGTYFLASDSRDSREVLALEQGTGKGSTKAHSRAREEAPGGDAGTLTGDDPWPALDEVLLEASMRNIPEACARAWWGEHDGIGGVSKGGQTIRHWRSHLGAYAVKWAANDHTHRPPGAANNRPTQAGGLSGAEMVVRQKELEECERRIGSILNSYDAHQTITADDREKLKPIRARRSELRKLLGFKI